MNTIKFKIEKQNLVRDDSEKIIDWSKGYLNAEFELKGSDWVNDNNYTKYALFRHGELSFAIPLARKTPAEPVYECTVPHEILRYNSFILTTYAAGVKGSEAARSRITTNSLNIQVGQSEFTTNLMTPREPSKDAFTLIFDELDKKLSISDADSKITTAIEEAISKIHFPVLTIISDKEKSSPDDVEGAKGDIWVNIFTTASTDTPPAITTTVLQFKHNGTNWEGTNWEIM